jgi:lysophospholipase L1-like esterase
MKQLLQTSFLVLGLFTATIVAAQTPAPAATSTQKTKEHIILCLGDSLTEGYGVPSEKSWPSLMQERLAKQRAEEKAQRFAERLRKLGINPDEM